MNQAIRDSCKKPEEAEKGRVEIRPSIPFVSDASYSDLDKDKSKFIEVTCRYTPENANTTQWTVGSSEQQKGEVRMPRN